MGAYYITGGMYRLIDALASVARKLNVQIYTSSKVDKICHDGKRISGVQVNGEKIEANYVLCGADVVVAHHELIDKHQHQREKLNRLEPSLSGMVFLWGIKGKYPALAHHNTVFSKAYDVEFDQILDFDKCQMNRLFTLP